MQHLYISNQLQNEVNSPCEIVVECDGSDAATLYRLDAVTVEGHPVGAVRRTIEGDVTQRSDGRYASIQPIETDGRCRSRSDLLTNGLAFGDRGLQGERTFAETFGYHFSVVAVVAPFWRGGLKQFICLRGELGGLQGVIGVVGERGGRKGGRLAVFALHHHMALIVAAVSSHVVRFRLNLPYDQTILSQIQTLPFSPDK